MTVNANNTNNATINVPDAPEVQEQTQDATMSATGNTGIAAPAAAETAEDTGVIERQQATIDKLIEQTASLQNQINVLLRNGASVTGNAADSAADAQTDDITAQDDYVSLAELGAEFGTRRYENINREGV